ncbi:MAG: hypothetical protein AABY11_00960 [archaeon]
MNGYCCNTNDVHPARNFLTHQERIEWLKDYKNQLDNESKGVGERIKDLEEKIKAA